MVDSGDVAERIASWCRLEHLTVIDPTSAGLTVRLEARPDLDVRVDPGSAVEPVRLRASFPAVEGGDLPSAQVETLLEEVVIRRSALVDARMDASGAVDVVAVIYPDGLTRNAFMSALFECQKLRDSVVSDVRAALEAKRTLDALERSLAET
jgi:hypothetical protein